MTVEFASGEPLAWTCPSIRTAADADPDHAVRQNGYFVEVRVTWEPGDAARLTAEAVADAGAGKVNCIVAGGGDGTINEVFATAYSAGLPERCSLGVLPLGTANDFAHATGVPVQDPTAALQLAANTPPRWIDVGFLNRIGLHRSITDRTHAKRPSAFWGQSPPCRKVRE